jgi:hypothetical protein
MTASSADATAATANFALGATVLLLPTSPSTSGDSERPQK